MSFTEMEKSKGETLLIGWEVSIAFWVYNT